MMTNDRELASESVDNLVSLAWDRSRVLSGTVCVLVGALQLIFYFVTKNTAPWWSWVVAGVLVPVGFMWLCNAKARIEVGSFGVRRDTLLDHDNLSWDQVGEIVFIKTCHRFLLVLTEPEGVRLTRPRKMGLPAGTWDEVLDPQASAQIMAFCEKFCPVSFR